MRTVRPPTTTFPAALLAVTAVLTAPLTVALTVAVMSPTTVLARWVGDVAGRLHRDDDGVSDLVVGLLMAGGMALIVIAVLAIIRPWAENQADNLPGN